MKTIHLNFALSALLLTHTCADETLEPISVISTNKTDQSIQETTANITVITSQEIEEKGYQTVAQAINSVSGITNVEEMERRARSESAIVRCGIPR